VGDLKGCRKSQWVGFWLIRLINGILERDCFNLNSGVQLSELKKVQLPD